LRGLRLWRNFAASPEARGRDGAMQTYVIEANIRRFRALLESETAPDKREVLSRLLADEEAKLAAMQATGPLPTAE
jgi:hypothetical protein